MSSPGCTHDTYEFAVEASIIESPEAFTFAAISARCAECHEPFHWRGVNAGHPQPLEPSCTADGFVLYAPISAGPGAIVGLLERTGLADQLVDPNGLPASEARIPRL
jgi:hypothetical protein